MRRLAGLKDLYEELQNCLLSRMTARLEQQV
jgi:hypothetical protein